MSYQYIGENNQILPYNQGKVVCVGRNYAAHAAELGNEIPSSPVIFMKPYTSLVNWDGQVTIPKNRGEVHHECELAVLIGETISQSKQEDVFNKLAGVTLALDLTLRDVQQQLKDKSHPWELAKAFDRACPVASWFTIPNEDWLQQAKFSFQINGSVQQKGEARLMLWPVIELIAWVSNYITLSPGDIVLTGTPAGVGPLQQNQKITACLDGLFSIESLVEVK